MSKCPASASTVKIERLTDIWSVLRSKSIVQDPDVSCDNYIHPTPLAEINARQFQDGNLNMINGDAHRHRRKLLNALVRPEALERFRESVVLPSLQRWLTGAARPTGDGLVECDLAAIMELVFLEFSAKIIGIIGTDTDEGMARLRACALPIFAGLSASHFGDREAVTKAGLTAKKIFVEEYFWPSYNAHKALLDRVAAGELTENEVPLSLMHMIVTGADEGYRDHEWAIHEAILFFVAATGTSVQAILATVHDLCGWFEKHPEDAARVEDLSFLSSALQESLRLKAPYVSYITRLATDNIETGCPIKAGDQIHAFIPRAGKDISTFGPDASEFNPLRKVPDGVSRYGMAFGGGPHQCLGLRVVLGNDGREGGHIRIVQELFRAGVRRHPAKKPEILSMGENEVADNIPTFTSYPVILTKWAHKQ